MTVISKALHLWQLEDATVTLIAERENSVYRVDHATGQFALRLHRQGYRTDAQLKEELDWMAWVAQSGLSVPSPIRSTGGLFLETVGNVQVDILNWLSGDTLDLIMPKLDQEARKEIFYSLGRDMARLHIASDTWPKASTCNRPAWDIDGLLGNTPLWDRFWENPGLTAKERELLLVFRTHAKNTLAKLSEPLDYGLIHADMVPANVMVDQEGLHFIDFDDGGFGFRLFELATALLKHSAQPDFENLKSAMIDGYRSERPLDTTHLGLFLGLRASTYVGWNITRMVEDNTGARNTRFIDQAVDLATTILGLNNSPGKRRHQD